MTVHLLTATAKSPVLARARCDARRRRALAT